VNIELQGQHALVTGGTSGIGRAAAIALAACGCSVAVTGVTAREVTAFENDPACAGIAAFPLDVADSSAVIELVRMFPQLDILVNAAGIGGQGPVEFTEEAFMRSIDINVSGTMRVCYAARAALSRRGGAIVNIASIMSFFGSATAPAYSAGKGAVVQFTKSLALGWADSGIRVNAVAPGWIDTPMTKVLQADEQRNGRIISRSPMKRWGKPEEIAAGIVFLCSPMASFVTGVVLPIDGGYMVTGM
jgi:NAD(P)-dependent dehydrogenase (short-subunit alcohol dehydrogenase family)